jgi:hypothetical protein
MTRTPRSPTTRTNSSREGVCRRSARRSGRVSYRCHGLGWGRLRVFPRSLPHCARWFHYVLVRDPAARGPLGAVSHCSPRGQLVHSRLCNRFPQPPIEPAGRLTMPSNREPAWKAGVTPKNVREIYGRNPDSSATGGMCTFSIDLLSVDCGLESACPWRVDLIIIPVARHPIPVAR